jgi:hypothetical protein
MPDDLKVVDYAPPSKRHDRLMLLIAALGILCFCSGLSAGFMALLKWGHPGTTIERRRYEEARVTIQATQPTYRPPPFVGRSFNQVSIWSFGETYISIALVSLGTTAVVLSFRRSGRMH